MSIKNLLRSSKEQCVAAQIDGVDGLGASGDSDQGPVFGSCHGGGWAVDPDFVVAAASQHGD